MIEAIKDSESEGYPIIVRILVSIDRRQGLENARVAVDLAEKLMNEDNIVVGIDFSGDPEVSPDFFVKNSSEKLLFKKHCVNTVFCYINFGNIFYF